MTAARKAIQHSTVLGGRFNVTSGNSSIAGGSANTAGSYAEVVLGSHATEVAGNTTGITVTDRLFVLGNGINPSSRSDALWSIKMVMQHWLVTLPRILIVD